MRVTLAHRKKLEYYLHQFYKRFPEENFTIFHLARYLKARQKNRKDAWIGVSGETGGGKSYFAIMCQILLGKRYNLARNVTYIPKGNEIVEKFEKLKRSTLLIDEAAAEMRAVNWQSKQQQKVNITAMTERYKENIIFLNMPNFDEFTKSMRRGSLLFRAIVVYRDNKCARVIIQRKSRNWRSSDPWGDNAANAKYESLEQKRREIDNNTILSIERSIPNTVMDFVIPNLEIILPDVAAEYNRLKIESRKIAEDEGTIGETKVNKFQTKYYQLLARVTKVIINNELHIGKLPTIRKKVAEALGISSSTLTKYYEMSEEKFKANPRSKIIPSPQKSKS